MFLAKIFHPADTVDLLVCSYAGIPRSALDTSRRNPVVYLAIDELSSSSASLEYWIIFASLIAYEISPESASCLIEPSLGFILSLELRKEEKASVKVEILFIPRSCVRTIEGLAVGMVIRHW